MFEVLVLVAREGFYGLVRAWWIGGCGCEWDRGRSREGGAGRGVEVLPLLRESQDQSVSEKEWRKKVDRRTSLIFLRLSKFPLLLPGCVFLIP